MKWREDDMEYIIRHLGQPESLSDEEFVQWLKEEEHRMLFEAIRNDREAFLYKTDFGNISVEEEYKRFSGRLRERKHRLYVRWSVAAASFLIALGTIWGLYRDEMQSVEVAKNEIYAGRKVAELILADGQRIRLDDQVINIQEQNGIQITNDTNCQLAYLLSDEKKEMRDTALVYNTICIPAGADYMLRLSDGTTIHLNCETEFRYPVQFAGNERRVFLSGEAFFDVKKAEEWPFIVETESMKIQVTGTRFNVKAYQQDEFVHTTLVEGQVSVDQLDGSGATEILSPAQQFILDTHSGIAQVREVDVQLYTGWVDGMFVFKNQRLEDIMQTLARWYSIQVYYTEPSVKNICLSAHLDRYEHIDTILNIIQATHKIDFIRKGDVVTVFPKQEMK